MKKEIKVWAITLIAFWWLAPNKTNAQQDSTKSNVLNEVVVTATKFPKSQSETGKVLTVIDEEQLQQSAGKNLAQLLNDQAGIVISGANSNSGKDKSVYLRGAAGQYTLITIDGIPINDPSGAGGAFDLRLLPIDQIERIEILKGSQSTLYGTDAIAGVINIITKKGGDRPIGGFGLVSYGSYNTMKAGAGINGSTKTADYNIGYTYLKTDGISEAKDNNKTGNFDKDGYDQNSFQANLGWQATKSFKVKPFFRYTDFNGKYDAGSFKDDTTAKYTSNIINPGLTAQYQLRKGAVNLNYSYNKTKRTFEDAYGKYLYNGRFNNAELFVNYDLGSVVQLLGGLSVQDLKMLDSTSTEKNPSVIITSPYLSIFLHNLNGFALELGGRYNAHSKYGNNFTYSFNPSYLLDQKLKLFFNYTTGFKAPTLYQLFGKYGANPALKPELSNSIEGGVQVLAVENKIDLRVVAFGRKIKDAIQYMPNAGINVNLDKQNDYGVEAEAGYRPASKLNFKMFYAYVNGKFTTKNNGKDTTYFNLIRRPKHSIGFNMTYQIMPQFLVSANVKTFSKRTDLFFNMDTYTNQNVSLDSYLLLDVYAEYKFFKQQLTLFIDAKNLLNQNYYEVYGYATMGTNVNVGLNFKF